MAWLHRYSVKMISFGVQCRDGKREREPDDSHLLHQEINLLFLLLPARGSQRTIEAAARARRSRRKGQRTSSISI